MAAAPTKDALMGYHLLADVKHDFGTGEDVPTYNIGGEKAALGGLSEDEVVTYCLEGAGKTLINDYDARKKGEIAFPIVTKTASFTPSHPPVLYAGGNDKIGIVQDAGEIITGALGAKNVLTFGSILDPAGKPVSAATTPIWFHPVNVSNTVDIPLAPFGFDPQVISGIRVATLTAGTVRAGFYPSPAPAPPGYSNTIGAGVLDAVSMNGTLATNAKPINKTDIKKAGFFVGIEKAAGLDKLLQEDLPDKFKEADLRKKFTNTYKKYFYIAKTLGDTMLVASCMPSFSNADLSGSIANPFYGLPVPEPPPELGRRDPGQWKSWVGGDAVAAPSILMMKTGDRLNWLRAILFNVPTIYEQQAKAGKGKHYVFFPGQADPAAIRVAILSDFTKLGTDCQTRYQQLKTSLGELYGAGLGVDVTLTTFAPGGRQELKPTGAAAAKALIVDIQAQLDVLSARVTAWIETRRQTVERDPAITIEKLRTYYTETLTWANACTPQTNTIFIQKGRQERYLSSSVIIAKVPKAPADISQWPLKNSIDIALRNAFARLNKPASNGDTLRTRIAGTDIDNRFFQKIPPAPTPDIPLDAETAKETIAEVVGAVDPPPEVQVGGANIMVVIDHERLETILESFPTIRGFIEYIKSKVDGVSEQHQFLSVFDVVRRRNTDRIFDAVLASTLTNELQTMISNIDDRPIYFRHLRVAEYDISPIFADDYVFINRGLPSNSSTLLFNAYTYSINATNATIFNTNEEVADSVTQASIEFTETEKKYVDSLAKRGGKVVFGPFEEVLVGGGGDAMSTGGLRPRRPLYSNARGSNSLPLLTDNNPRLRKRSRTSRTRRVRQSTRKSKTRR